MKKHLIILINIVLVAVLCSCQQVKLIEPEYRILLENQRQGQLVFSINKNELKITRLVNHFYKTDVNYLLQNNLASILSIKEWNYDAKNVKSSLLVFDSITLRYNAENGTKLKELLNYIPTEDMSFFPRISCADSCSGRALAINGCVCKFLLQTNYKGYNIFLNYKLKQFKCEIPLQEISILIMKDSKQIEEVKIKSLEGELEGDIQFFKTNDALYLYYMQFDSEHKKTYQSIVKVPYNALLSTIF